MKNNNRRNGGRSGKVPRNTIFESVANWVGQPKG